MKDKIRFVGYLLTGFKDQLVQCFSKSLTPGYNKKRFKTRRRRRDLSSDQGFGETDYRGDENQHLPLTTLIQIPTEGNLTLDTGDSSPPP